MMEEWTANDMKESDRSEDQQLETGVDLGQSEERVSLSAGSWSTAYSSWKDDYLLLLFFKHNLVECISFRPPTNSATCTII